MKKTVLFLLTTILLLTIACSLTEPATPPEMEISISSEKLVAGTTASIHLRVKNLSERNWENHKIIVGYAIDDEINTTLIKNEIPFNLASGESYEEDISWRVTVTPVPNASYRIVFTVIDADSIEVASTTRPIEFVSPVIDINITPTELIEGDEAIINLNLTKPDGISLENYSIFVGYSKANTMEVYLIDDIPLSLGATENFSKEIPWLVNYITDYGEYKIQAILLAPDSTEVASEEISVTISAP